MSAQWAKALIRPVTYSLIVYLLQACAYLPVTKPQLVNDKDCQLISKELQLEEKQLTSGGACSGAACSALLVIPASTFLVSGSIVLIGNSLHWLEKNGTCSDGLIRKNLDQFINWAFHSGGEKLEH